MYIISLIPVYVVACLCIGLAATPGLFIFQWIHDLNIEPMTFRYLCKGIAIAIGYFFYGFCLIFILPAVAFIFNLYPKEGRYPAYSLESFKWYFYNSLIFLMRLTFLEVITPTPLSNLFFKLMGMKLGEKVYNNTSYITDANLIEIGNNVTIGGSATIIAHYSQRGVVIINPVKISSKVTIGLRAIVFGGVEIGEGATLMPNSVVLPKTKIPAGEVWGGVPATKIR